VTQALQLQACIEIFRESGRDLLLYHLQQAVLLSSGFGRDIRPQVRRVLRVVTPELNEDTALSRLSAEAGTSRDLSIAALYERLEQLSNTDRDADFQEALGQLRRLQSDEAEHMNRMFRRDNPLSMAEYAKSLDRAKNLLASLHERSTSTNDPVSDSDS
jgi:hypothetical protein